MSHLYFDAAATTPLAPEVREAMTEAFDLFGNPGSKHVEGYKARKHVDECLERMAKVLGVGKDQLVITHGGTDGNRKVLWALRKRWCVKDLFCSAVEHSSISDEIPENQWFDPVDFKGLPGDAKFAALMYANNETGRIYDMQGCRKKFLNTLLLCDWVHGAGKVEFKTHDADFITFSAHKFGGPKGVGLLYIRNPELFPELSKDTHTKDIVGISGMARAFELQDPRGTNLKLRQQTALIEDFIARHIPEYLIHEAEHPRVPGTVNVAFRGVRGSELMAILSEEEGICISTGSACTQDVMSPTKVIQYIQPIPHWQYPVRISLHKGLSDADIQSFCEILAHYITELRKR